MNDEELFRRTRDILNPALAKKQTWSFIGVGSGGARAADEAVRFGVGGIILVDRPGKVLEEHHIIRHILGYRDRGRLKVEALRDHLLNINPSCNVETVGMDVSKSADRLRQIVERSTQVHLCTDNEPSKHEVNREAVRAGVPMVFAGVFDGGCGGEVGRVTPGGACYACIAAYLNRDRDLQAADRTETFDYANPGGPEKSTAALNLDIAQIALLQARVGLLTLLAGQDPAVDMPGNYILFGNRPVEGLFDRMLRNDIWAIPRDPHCMICGQGDMSEAQLRVQAESILQAALGIGGGPV